MLKKYDFVVVRNCFDDDEVENVFAGDEGMIIEMKGDNHAEIVFFDKETQILALKEYANIWHVDHLEIAEEIDSQNVLIIKDYIQKETKAEGEIFKLHDLDFRKADLEQAAKELGYKIVRVEDKIIYLTEK